MILNPGCLKCVNYVTFFIYSVRPAGVCIKMPLKIGLSRNYVINRPDISPALCKLISLSTSYSLYMSHNTKSEIRILIEKLKVQTDRYALAVREGNFADAKAITNAINQLQIDMDNLTPYIHTETKDMAEAN